MSSAALTHAEAARIMRDVKDKSYQLFPLGREWAEFLRAKRMAGCRPNTLDSYETVGDKLAKYFADFTGLERFAERPDLILDFLDDTWPDVDPDTLQQRFAVLASFFEWAYRTDRIIADPMRKVERPRRRRKEAARPRVPEEHISVLVSRQDSLRDQGAILLLGRLGLRREDLRLLQLRDVDLATDEIQLRHAKGGKEHVLPIAFRQVREILYLHMLERGGALTEEGGTQLASAVGQEPAGETLAYTPSSVSARPWAPEEYLLYPKTSRTRPMSRSGIDQWFRRCMTKAELVGYTMHQLRHSAIDEVRRQTRDLELARQLGRHANVATTQTYLHSSLEDLRTALEAMQEVEA